MRSPNCNRHVTEDSAGYLRSLLIRGKLTQLEAAVLLGVDPRTMRRYVSASEPRVPPYTVQYALEALAEFRSRGY